MNEPAEKGTRSGPLLSERRFGAGAAAGASCSEMPEISRAPTSRRACDDFLFILRGRGSLLLLSWSGWEVAALLWHEYLFFSMQKIYVFFY